jgi:hypothetical protein
VRIERSLGMMVMGVVLAAAGLAATIYLRANTWEPDLAPSVRASARQPNVRTKPSSSARPRNPVGAQALRPPVPGVERPARHAPPRRAASAEDRAASQPRRVPLRPAATPVPLDETGPVAAPPGAGITRDETYVPPPPIQGPKYVVRVSAIRDLTRAEEIVARMARGGFRATIETSVSGEAARHLVVSEPLPRSTAVSRAQALAAVGIATTMRDRDGDRVQLVFGVFAGPDEADAAARRVRRRGYPAVAVIEGGTTYIVHVGPHEKEQMEDVLALLSSGLHVVDVAPAP